MIIDNETVVVSNAGSRYETLTSSTIPKTFKPEKIFTVPRKDLPHNSGVSVSVEYCNHTKSMLYLKPQSGIVTTLVPEADSSTARRSDRHLEIRITTIISRSQAVDVTKNLLSHHREESRIYPMTQDASVFLDGIESEKMRDGGPRSISSFSQTTVINIPYAQIEKIEALYIRETDTLLSLHPSIARVPHPNSSEGVAAIDVGRVKATPGSVGVLVKAIDNEGLAGRRFMFSGKDAIMIPTFEDMNMESGVYITLMNADQNGDITRTTKRYSYEEAEKDHGIYRTREQAMTSGDPKAKLTHDTERLRVETVERKSEADQSAHELKMVQSRWEAFLNAQKQASAENDRIREERHKDMLREIQEKNALTERIRQLEKEAIDRDALARKDYYDYKSRHRDDYYEDRSSVRKDSSEILKYVPAFIMGLAGAFAIFRYGAGGKSGFQTRLA